MLRKRERPRLRRHPLRLALACRPLTGQKNRLWHQTFSEPLRLYLWDANRLQPQSWINAEWGTSDNNRKAWFCSITGCGRRQLFEDAACWQRPQRDGPRTRFRHRVRHKMMISRLRQFALRLLAHFRAPALDSDLDTEMAAHLQFAIADSLQRGLSPSEAR